MPAIESIEGASRESFKVQVDSRGAEFSLFHSKTGCKHAKTLLFVSHGFQKQPAQTIPAARSTITAYGFFVPMGNSLQRTRYDDWLPQLITTFSGSPLAFATAGTPDVVVGAHYLGHELGKDIQEMFAKAVKLCDIVVFDDIDANGDLGALNDCAATSFPTLVEKSDVLRRYDYMLMHCCRPPWPLGQGKGPVVPQGLYAYDDAFRVLLD